jgi:hypothetical protein
METEPIVDNHTLLPLDHIVHDDNALEYESEKSSDEEDIDEPVTNQTPEILAKRGSTRLVKFRAKHDKPGAIKLKVTFDAFGRVTGENRAVFVSFLGDVAREQIGVKILHWKKVNKESRDKLWDEILVHIYYFVTQYYISLCMQLHYVQLINNIVLIFSEIFCC